MKTLRENQAPVKLARPSRPRVLTIASSSAEPGGKVFISIRAPGETQDSDYWFERIPSDWAIAVHVSKIWDGRQRDFASEEYDVLVDGPRSQCECKGFLRHGHCRHVTAVIQLLAEGKLTLPPRPEAVVGCHVSCPCCRRFYPDDRPPTTDN